MTQPDRDLHQQQRPQRLYPLKQQQQTLLQPAAELSAHGPRRTAPRWRMPASAAHRTTLNTAAGCRDLTKNNRSKSLRCYTGFSTDYNDDETFWPAVYFAYKGSGDVKKGAAIPGWR